jgi:3-oxoacyl-[acyl-carrier-protein] synthase II
VQPLPTAITGLGLCTALGESAAATWDALLAGRFIATHSRALGDVSEPRVISLALRAAKEAVEHAGWDVHQRRESALVIGTSKGPIESWLSGIGQCDIASPAQSFGLASLASTLGSSLQIAGPRLTLSTACASGLHALVRGIMLLHEGCRRVVIVGAESSLHPLFLGSFQRLGVLAPAAIGCRPFDEDRAGFLVSEAAAAVCLEAPRRGAFALVERFALGADATHLLHGDPQSQSLRRLLTTVIDNRPLDLVHAHATATIANDPLELAAIESSLAQSDRPNIYSHKGALGHSLGAAGLIAVVLNCMCHEKGIVPPNVRTNRPLPMERVRLSATSVARPIHRSLVVASGFGGAAAAVTLTSP